MANRAKPTGIQTNRGSSTGDASKAWSVTERAAGVAIAPGVSGDTPALPSDYFFARGPRASDDGGAAAGPRAGDNATALHARSEGATTRLVGLLWADAYQAVLALPGSGIGEPAQLAGRRLGLPAHDERFALDLRRVAASRGFHSATALSCLFSDEYDEVDVEIDDRVRDEPYASEGAALLRGEVDAIYVAGAAGRALARRIGAVEVVALGAHLDPMVRVNVATPLALTATQAQLDHDPGAVAQWLATQEGAALDARNLAALTAQKDWLRTHGFLAGDVDVATWIEPGPLAAARSLA